jgi:hypothetical protein
MNSRLKHVLLATTALSLTLPLLILGQEGQQEGRTEEPPAEAELVFEREVFAYPTFSRRNPFHPLDAGDDGPRFEDMQLLGVIFSTDPASSVALLGAFGGNGNAAGLRTYRVRRGDRLGNTRILQIQRTRVIVEVEEFGLTEQRALEVKRPGEGGSR